MPNKLKEKFKKLFIAEMSPGVILAAYRLLYDGDIPNTIDQSLLVNNAQKQGYIHIGTKERIELYKYLFVGDMGTVLVKDNDAGFYPETVSGMLQQLNLEANGKLQNFTDTPPVLDNPEDPTTLGDFYEGEAPTATDMMEQFAAATGLMLINGEMLEDVEFPEDFATMPFSEFLTTTAEASGGYFSIIDDKLVFIPFGGYGANLIKEDFSDFIAYGGATVTKNKTFPIDVFKGGRNLIIESLNFRKKPISGSPITEVSGSYGKLDIFINNPDNLSNGSYVANIMVDTLKSFQQINKLPQGTEYTAIVTMRKVSGDNGKIITLHNESDGGYKDLIGSDSVGDIFKHTYSHRVRGSSPSINPHLGIGEQPNGTRIEISSIKYVLGHIDGSNEPYSPAPEDGYGYTGDDGAYHIQTRGGDDNLKYYTNISSVLPIGTPLSSSVEVKNFGERMAWHATRIEDLTYKYIKTNEHLIVSSKGKTLEDRVVQSLFRTTTLGNNLDFIASDPSIRESYPLYKKFSFTAMTPHDILGIHRLIGSDNVNDAHNQKILIENAEAMGFIQVNTNTRAHVGETVYIDVQGNVYVYPDPTLID